MVASSRTSSAGIRPHMARPGARCQTSMSRSCPLAVRPLRTTQRSSDAPGATTEPGQRTESRTSAPGPTETELLTAANGTERLEGYARMTPLGRLGQPDDIAGVVAFLAEPEASWVTGQVIRANGGMA